MCKILKKNLLHCSTVSGSSCIYYRPCLARAGFIAGVILGGANFFLTGSGNIWQLCSCIQLFLSLRFGTWKNRQLPALVFTLLWVQGGIVSCISAMHKISENE